MAKDPAMLWYWNDWYGGTATFTRHLKGCYMDLLHAQFNTGHLSLEEIKTVLGTDFGSSWPTLQKKFKADESGLFFNEKSELEKQKRVVYSESRRKNRQNIPKSTYDESYDKHMIAHMENENEVVLAVPVVKAVNHKWCSTPIEKFDLTTSEISQSIEFIDRLRQIKLNEPRVKDLWIAFQTNHFTGEKHYPTRSKCLQHFREWLKNPSNGTDQRSAKSNTEKWADWAGGFTSTNETGK